MTPIPDAYMFEDALEKAVAAHLLAKGINDPAKQRDDKALLTPRVELKAMWNGWGPSGQAPHMWQGGVTYGKWPDAGTGKLYCKVITRRDDPDQNHARVRGTVRVNMQSCSALSARMAFHKCERMQETATVPDFQQDQNYDISTMSFDFTMSVLFDSKTTQIFLS